MKSLVFQTVLFSFFLLSTIQAQDVRVSNVHPQNSSSVFTYAGPTADFTWNIQIQGANLQVNDGLLSVDDVLSFDFSPDRRHLGVLLKEGDEHHVQIFNSEGYLIAQYSDIRDVDLTDPSLKLYLLGGGAVVLRDNIVSFALFNLKDLYVGRISNSSGNTQGEAMSRLATSPDGRHLFAYNPRIISNSGFSSRISKISEDGTIEPFFYDDAREIVHISVSESGDRLIAVFKKDDQALMRIISTEAEVISEMEAPMENAGFYVQPEHNTITWFSGNAAQVYDLNSGERLANAFLRNQNIIFATYNPDDNVVVTLTGRRSYQNMTMNMEAVRVVDLNARTILHSEDINITAEYTEDVEPGIVRTGTNRYRLTGMTNALDIVLRR